MAIAVFQKIKKLKFYETIKHGSIYTFSFGIIQLISLLSLPIYTKLLLPQDFGIYEVFNHVVRITTLILSLNLFNGYYRYYFDEGVDKDVLLKYTIRISLFSFLLGAILLLVFRNILLQQLNIPNELFLFIISGILANIILNIFTSYNNASLASQRQAIWQIVIQLLKVFSAVLCLYFISKNYLGRVMGETIITLILSVVVLALYFRRYISLNGSPGNAKDIMRYSVSFIPIGLSGYFLGFVDTIMINSMIGNSDAGLYSYAYKIAVIYSGITTSFITANRPKLFDLYAQDNSHEIKGQFSSMFKLIVACSTLFIFFSETGGAILALNPAFHASLYLLPILVLSYIFSDLNELFSFFYYYEKKVKYFYYNFAISAILNITLNIFLLPRYGYKAAAYTTLISYAFMSTITYATCKLILKAKIPAVVNYLHHAFIIVIVFVVNYLLQYSNIHIWFSLCIKAILYIMIILYLWKNLIQKMLTQ